MAEPKWTKEGRERAYRSGWAACMRCVDELPPDISNENRALWLQGWWDAFDAPLGSWPGVGDLVRVGAL